MLLAPFALERYFARHEFRARHLLSSSDCETRSLAGLLTLADDETLRLWQELRLGYTESRGLPLLREEVARLYPGLDAADVLCAVPQEAIFLAMHGLLEAGDRVVVTSPCYQSLHEVARSIGCEVVHWMPERCDGAPGDGAPGDGATGDGATGDGATGDAATGDEAAEWRFEPDALAALLRGGAKLIVVNFPHNPTGALPTPDEWTRIVALAAASGAWLFSDEMYRFLGRAPGCERTAVSAAGYERAIALGGLSKAFGLPGLRQGWLASRDRGLLERVAELKDYTTICGAGPSEVLALIGLRARSTLVAESLAQVDANLAALDAFLAATPGLLRWRRPRAGSVGLARLEGPETASRFCERAVAEAGVLLVPSSLFGYGDAHVRLGLGRAGFPEGLEALRRWTLTSR